MWVNSRIESSDSKILSHFNNRIITQCDGMLSINSYIIVSVSNDPILIDLVFKGNKREILRQRNSNSNNLNRRWKLFTSNTMMASLMCIIRSKYSFGFNGSNK